MKKIYGFVGLVLFIFMLIYFQTKTTGTLTSSSTADAEFNYCMAIRGNGELEPAHWGGLARTVEKLGLPSAMAGGSSATISMFWLNSIAMHPLIKSESGEIQKLRASLLIKSLLGFFNEAQKTQSWQNLMNLYGEFQQIKSKALTEEALNHLTRRDFKKVLELLKQAQTSEILNIETLDVITQAVQRKDLPRAQFYLAHTRSTICPECRRQKKTTQYKDLRGFPQVDAGMSLIL